MTAAGRCWLGWGRAGWAGVRGAKSKAAQRAARKKSAQQVTSYKVEFNPVEVPWLADSAQVSADAFLQTVLSDSRYAMAARREGVQLDMLKSVAPAVFEKLGRGITRSDKFETQEGIKLNKTFRRGLSDVHKATALAHVVIHAKRHFADALANEDSLKKLADLRQPHTWFAKARQKGRRVIMHLGPTNSGKTHAAIEALRKAPSGAYCSPLRMLAWEIYDKLQRVWNVPCNLKTGQERGTNEGARHCSTTIEIADLYKPIDVAVIDEIQLIGDDFRGWAWTRALLGMPAAEIHLCGDPSAETIVRRLLAKTGEKLEVREYKRLQPLMPVSTPLPRNFGRLRRGDCIIAFTRRQLYEIKSEIESQQNLKVSVVYGGLPPEVRRQQAELFNRQDGGTDVLVATDSIGMGMNLQIGRIIFSSTSKFDGNMQRELTPSEIRQIAGRAGRYGSVHSSGEVATVSREDADLVLAALSSEPSEIRRAGILPEPSKLNAFASLRAETPVEASLGGLLELFEDLARTDETQGLYFVCSLTHMKVVAEMLTGSGLDLARQYTFCMAPIRAELPLVPEAMSAFARMLAEETDVPLGLDEGELNSPSSLEDMQKVEGAITICDTYIWLSKRFSNFFEAVKAHKLRREFTGLASHGVQGLRVATSEIDPKSRAYDWSAAEERRRTRIANNFEHDRSQDDDDSDIFRQLDEPMGMNWERKYLNDFWYDVAE